MWTWSEWSWGVVVNDVMMFSSQDWCHYSEHHQGGVMWSDSADHCSSSGHCHGLRQDPGIWVSVSWQCMGGTCTCILCSAAEGRRAVWVWGTIQTAQWPKVLPAEGGGLTLELLLHRLSSHGAKCPRAAKDCRNEHKGLGYDLYKLYPSP